MTTHQRVTRVLTLTLVLNLLVAFGKIGLGLVTGALAITADGFHSLTDGAGNVAGLIAVRYAQRPPDADHPYGHHRFETLGALFIGVLLFITAWEVIQSVLERLHTPTAPDVNPLTLAVLVGTLFINIGVSRYQIHMGNRLNSQILLADAQNTASDVFVTLAVLSSAVIMTLTGWVWLDAVVALVVVGLIARAGLGILRQTGRVLVDTAPYSPEQLLTLVAQVPDVRQIVRVRSRGTPQACTIDVDVTLPAEMTIGQSQTVADRIRATLQTTLAGVEEVEVHFSPN